MQPQIVTGIYGGSFNPIHNGHVSLARELCQKGLVDELWFVVSPHNPHKQQADLLADEARLALARLAVHHEAQLKVSDVEFQLPRPSYMIHTLNTLSKSYPNREFVLIIGADNWERFPLWYQHEQIVQNYRIAICPRPGYTIKTTPNNVFMADTSLWPISSTAIRERINNENYAGEDLHPAVWNEIKLKGYYK